MTHPNSQYRLTRPYQEQLARAGRLYGRVLQRTVALKGSDGQFVDIEGRVIVYQDDVLSFFIHCWHVRDWLKHDTTVDGAARTRALAATESSRWLQVCADLANGTKHFELQRSRVGAEQWTTRAGWASGNPDAWTLELYVNVGDGGDPIAAAAVAWEALRAWKQILDAEQLPLPPGFPDLTTRPTVSTPMCR